MSRKLVVIGVAGLSNPFVTPLDFEVVKTRYETARDAHIGFEVINGAMEKCYVPYEGLERVLAIWEVTPPPSDDSKKEQTHLKIPLQGHLGG